MKAIVQDLQGYLAMPLWKRVLVFVGGCILFGFFYGAGYSAASATHAWWLTP
jgi:hypothetical protein